MGREEKRRIQKTQTNNKSIQVSREMVQHTTTIYDTVERGRRFRVLRLFKNKRRFNGTFELINLKGGKMLITRQRPYVKGSKKKYKRKGKHERQHKDIVNE